MGGSIGLALFFGLFFVVGFLILGFGARSLYLSKQAESWPTTPGTIVSSELTSSTDSDGDTTYRTEVSYTYDAMGRAFTGDKIAFGYAGSSGYAFHSEIHDALSENTQVAVRYDPRNPERAVLSFGLNQSIIFMLIFGTVWTVFTLGIASLF